MKIEKGKYIKDSRWELLAPYQKHWNIPNGFLEAIYITQNKFKNNIEDIQIVMETGTYMGASTCFFAELVNIVITAEKYITKEKQDRYKTIKELYKNISFNLGDSPLVLEQYIKQYPNERILFILDAHNGDDSPLANELKVIQKYSNRNDHIIVIDDCVDLGSGTWPSKEECFELLRNINSNYKIEDTNTGRSIYIAYE